MRRSNSVFTFVFTAVFMVLSAKEVFAMHISEGILPPKDAILTSVLALPFVVIGLFFMKRLKLRNPIYFSLVGLIGAAIFVISAFPIPVPIVGTCSHPAGTGLSAIILGPFVSTVIACVALLIQALFMAHGGLTTLGANTLTMGVFGSFLGYAGYALCRKLKLSYFISGFIAGFIADIATYGATAMVLAFSLSPDFLPAFKEISLAFVPTQLPLSVLEGLITGFAVKYVFQHRPDLLNFSSRIFYGKEAIHEN